MSFGRDTNKDFFEKLHSNDNARNLRQIFEDDDKPLEEESSNLRYQPQASNKQKHSFHKQQHKDMHKQNKEQKQHKEYNGHKEHNSNNKAQRGNKEDAKPAVSWTTIIAKVVIGYNGSEPVGRVGVALSRNVAGGTKLVVYKSRCHLLGTLLLTKTLTTSSPRAGSAKVIMRESYLQFYDEEQTFWSLRFEKPEDEEEFLKIMHSYELGIHKEPTKDATSKDADETSPSTLVLALSSDSDNDNDSLQSTEESVQTTAVKRAQTTHTEAAQTQTQSMPSPSVSSQLQLYVAKHRTVQKDKQMSSLLKTICELSNKSDTDVAPVKDTRMEKIMLAIDCITNGDSALIANLEKAQRETDNEDEQLELEQKLLDIKKQNRSLAKSLKVQEHAFTELRNSSYFLCEELLRQNTLLRDKNSDLITAMSSQENECSSSSSLIPETAHSVIIQPQPDKPQPDTPQPDSSPLNSCRSCEQHVIRIHQLEKRMNALYDVLRTTKASCADETQAGSSPN